MKLVRNQKWHGIQGRQTDLACYLGKYYFGERLVYCRILPSKMVMVRVGGGKYASGVYTYYILIELTIITLQLSSITIGWVELSQ
jgi:hypothetical protein